MNRVTVDINELSSLGEPLIELTARHNDIHVSAQRGIYFQFGN